MANFDVADLALQAIAPGNKLLYDDKGLPSVMVRIPKMKMAQLISGWETDEYHPAFIVNGNVVDSIFISKYQNCVNNGRAYSLPAMPPANSMTWDTARGYCEAKGAGWHMMTAAEYALIALICQANGFLPYGNNNYGKDSRESNYVGIPCTWENDGRIRHILTGTGPITYSHNKQVDGIWDINGNVSEWTGGKRTVYGEIQLLVNNNAATWMAIDATTGAFITPDGTGTTTNSIKINKASNNKPQWDTAVTTTSDSLSCEFKDLTCAESISDAAKNTLIKYLLLLAAAGMTWDGDVVHFNNAAAERLFYAGGSYSSGVNAGVAYNVSGTRSGTDVGIGFRSAYVSLTP